MFIRRMFRNTTGAVLIAAGMFAGNFWRGDWEPVSQGPFTAWSAWTAAAGELYVRPSFSLSRVRGNHDADGSFSALADGEKWVSREEVLSLTFGITDRVEVSALVPSLQNRATAPGQTAQGAFDHGDGIALTKSMKPVVMHMDAFVRPSHHRPQSSSSRNAQNRYTVVLGG